MKWSSACSRILAAALLFALVAPLQAQVPVVRFTVERFAVEGDNPLHEARTQEVLSPFTGEHAGVDGLLAAADALERAIRDAGVAFQRVVLPPQSLGDGVVVLRVTVFRVGKVEVAGARHHSEANIRRSVPDLREGETPRTGAVARNLALANRLPWKSTTLTFRESETETETLDATLDVEDRRPWLVWSAFDNTGNGATGPFRWSVGASAGNLLDRDHALNASYVTSPGHGGQVRQRALGYAVPLYRLGGTLSASYVRSDIDTGRVLEVFDVSGSGAFAGVLYTHELGRRGPLTHRLSAGLDDRRFDNDLVFGSAGGIAVDLAPPPVRSRPVSLHYGAEYAGDEWGADLRVQYARNLKHGGGNDDVVYGINRTGARAGWDVWRGGATLTRTLPAGWTARGLFEGQLAGEPLIPGEQFGLGGASSVRGFSEREISGDEGVRTSVEVWSPPIRRTGLRFLLFADAGRVSREGAPVPGTPDDDSIASVGAGLRWSWKEHMSLLLDVGAITEGTATREHGARGHLSVMVRY